VAKSQTGKQVSRVGATGGGRTYRAQRPTNYYLVLVVILILGLVSVFWARSHYRASASSTNDSSTQPAVGTTSYAGIAFDVCGTLAPSLLPSTSAALALTAQAKGVIKVAPKIPADAGKNATVALFASGYPGLTVTSNSLKIPASAQGPAVNVANGQACPAGTPDAGKVGVVTISYWKNFATTTPTVTSDPTAIHFTSNSLVTVAFVPSGVHAVKPSTTTIQAMLQAPTVTTTPTPGSTTPPLAPISTTTTTKP
jgi:hypothetical protein